MTSSTSTAKLEQLKLPEGRKTEAEGLKEGWVGYWEHLAGQRKRIIVRKQPLRKK